MSSTSGVLSSPGALLAGAAMLGLLGGYLFLRLWRWAVPRAWTRSFREQLPGDVRGMLTAEEPAEMLRHYKAVLLRISAYALRNSVGLLLAVLPMSAFFLLLAAVDPSGRLAMHVEVRPGAQIAGAAAERARVKSSGDRWLASRSEAAELGLRVAGIELVGEMLADKHAICTSALRCALFEMMLFETHPSTGDASVVVRPAYLDGNPLWPYLNDAEFWFFLAAMLGSGAAAWRHRKSP